MYSKADKTLSAKSRHFHGDAWEIYEDLLGLQCFWKDLPRFRILLLFCAVATQISCADNVLPLNYLLLTTQKWNYFMNYWIYGITI